MHDASPLPSPDLNAARRHVLIVANPRAGAGPGHVKVQWLAAALEQHGIAARIEYDLSAVAEQAAELHSAGRLRAVVAAGGDGTVAEVVNRTAPGIPLAVLALGTENLLAKYLEMPREPEAVAGVIASGATMLHDAGSAAGRLFLLMASFGFDAEVVRRLHISRTGHIAHLSYVKPIWEAIRTYQYPELRIYCDDRLPGESAAAATEPAIVTGTESAGANGSGSGKCLIRARFAFLTNVPRYAFGLQFAPQALGDDGWFDLCTFQRGSFFSGLWYLSQVILRRHGRLADCRERRVRWLRIESDCPVPYELDGEACGYLPLEIEIRPNRLTLLVPPTWAERRRSLLKSSALNASAEVAGGSSRNPSHNPAN
jgi:diacylglycerol kinase family enzyme